MTDLTIQRLSADEAPAWPAELLPRAGYTGMPAWHDFIRKVYGYPTYSLRALQRGRAAGLLTLTHIRHPIFGSYLTTAPYASAGGFAWTSEEARDALLAEADALRRELKADYVVVRFDDAAARPPDGWRPHPIYAAFLIDLAPDPEALLAGYGSNHRNHVRKSLRRGFSIRFGRLELLDDVYEAIGRSMHELGSPYHSKGYLRVMAECLGKTLEFAVVYDGDGKAVGGGTFIIHGDWVNNLHANILRRCRADYAGEFLYWSAIERYGRAGFKVFDLGRSLIGSGNEAFKMKWNPRRVPLAYWYALPADKPIPALNQKSPKFRLAIALWKRMPYTLVKALGPSLICGLA